jgi:hypothetical protein
MDPDKVCASEEEIRALLSISYFGIATVNTVFNPDKFDGRPLQKEAIVF